MRHNDVIKVMQKELVIAQNIIKRPRDMAKLNQVYNFEDFELYRYPADEQKSRGGTVRDNTLNSSISQEKKASIVNKKASVMQTVFNEGETFS